MEFQLCNFTSLFEIFCTIYLAYIITDNISDTNFISTITEKILRKYSKIYLLFNEIDANVLGVETSLNNLDLPKSKDGDSEDKKKEVEKKHTLYKNSLKVIDTLKKKISLSKKEIFSNIKKSYQTKSFSFISLYLTFYCIIILFYAGFISNQRMPKAEFSLLCFDILTLIFLYFGWEYDAYEIGSNKKSFANKIVCFFAKTLKWNGYVFTLNIILLLVLISAFIPYLFEPRESEYYLYYKNSIVILTLMIPILNFFIYFRKASNRAELTRDNLIEKVNSISDELPTELEEVKDFISYFKVDKKLLIQQSIPDSN